MQYEEKYIVHSMKHCNIYFVLKQDLNIIMLMLFSVHNL
jgi:hypothetical protein